MLFPYLGSLSLLRWTPFSGPKWGVAKVEPAEFETRRGHSRDVVSRRLLEGSVREHSLWQIENLWTVCFSL